MIWLNLAPLVAVLLMVAKWERDKYVHGRKLSVAFQEGAEQAWQRVGNQALEELRRDTQVLLDELKVKIPLAVKVVATRDACRDFNTGKVTAVHEVVYFSGYAFQVHIAATEQYFQVIRYLERPAAEWRLER